MFHVTVLTLTLNVLSILPCHKKLCNKAHELHSEYTLKSTMTLTILSFILVISFQVTASLGSEVETPHWEELECEVHIIDNIFHILMH